VNDGTRKGIATTGAFAVVVMGVILLLVFRARWRVLVLPIVLLGTIWSFGTFGYLRIPLTMVTISGLPILIGLGVDFAIQVHSRYEEEIATGGDTGALERALVGIGPALTIAMIGAIVGFLALLLSQVPMVRDFGIMLAVGTAMLLVAVFAILPATLAARDRNGSSRIRRPRSGRLEHVVGWLTSVRAHPAVVVVVALLIVAAGATALRRTPVQSDPEKFVPQNSAAVHGLDLLQTVAGSTGDLGFIVDGDAQRPDLLAWTLAYERQELARHPDQLIQSNSVASTVAQVTGSTPTPGDVRAVMAVAPPGIRATLESADGHTAQIDFAVGNLSLDAEKTLLVATEADLHPPAGVRVIPSGLSVIGIATVDAMRNNQSTMALAALLAVFAWLLIRLRSARKAVLVVLPVVTAVALASLLVYLVGVQVSMLGALSSPIVIAVTTEFSVLLVERYGEERRRGHPADEAMAIGSHRIGRAFMTSGLTTAGGVRWFADCWVQVPRIRHSPRWSPWRACSRLRSRSMTRRRSAIDRPPLPKLVGVLPDLPVVTRIGCQHDRLRQAANAHYRRAAEIVGIALGADRTADGSLHPLGPGPRRSRPSRRASPAVVALDPVVRVAPSVVERGGQQLLDHVLERLGPRSPPRLVRQVLPEVAVGQAEAQIPAHRQHDHLGRQPIVSERRSPRLDRTAGSVTLHPASLAAPGEIDQGNRALLSSRGGPNADHGHADCVHGQGGPSVAAMGRSRDLGSSGSQPREGLAAAASIVRLHPTGFDVLHPAVRRRPRRSSPADILPGLGRIARWHPTHQSGRRVWYRARRRSRSGRTRVHRGANRAETAPYGRSPPEVRADDLRSFSAIRRAPT